MRDSLKRWALPGVIGLFGLCLSLSAEADTECKVSFFQGERNILPEPFSGWAIVRLAKAPFQILVRPSECSPLLATLKSTYSIAEVHQLSEVVFGAVGHGFAGRPDDVEVLDWPSRTPIRTTLNEISTAWADVDTYKAESDRLGYKPQLVKAWGAGFLFKPGATETVATFRRYTQAVALDSELPAFGQYAVLYLTVKELMKPTWHDAVAPYRLMKPYKILFVFE